MSNRWRIGFDIGGTFTDFILYDSQERSVRLHKRLTTPHDPSEAALIGLGELTEMAEPPQAHPGDGQGQSLAPAWPTRGTRARRFLGHVQARRQTAPSSPK